MWAKMPPERSFNLATISTRLPKIGERLLISGFRAGANEFEVGRQGGSDELTGSIVISTGVVTAIYLEGRDRYLIPWPVLEVNCPSLGGMSGGPIFDLNGKLVGILCSGVDSEIENEGTSYVSMLFPALSIEFEGWWPEQLFQGRQSLLDLNNRGCFIDKPSALKVTKDVAKGTQVLSYEPWE